jgi:acetyl-CoA C-acetyltransferase
MLGRLPVIVGVAQRTYRTDDPAAGREPLLMMEDVARAACADARTSGLAARVDSVRVVNMISASYADPAGALAERLGFVAGERAYTSVGGNTPQWLVNRTADDLVASRVRIALIAGAEALHTLRLAAKHRIALPWAQHRRHPPMIGDSRMGSHPDEWRHGAQMPLQIYPLFEIALRAHRREAPAAHHERLAALSASFARVAAENPDAWFRDGKTAATIGTVTERNRMVAFPYPKFMNPIIAVDQAAALVMTTAAEARTLGVPPERCIYLHGGGDAHDIWWIKDRVDYYSSPGMALAFEQALAQAAVASPALGPIDVYSCFPVASAFAANLLGFPADGSRSLTVTGGLPYFGGPGNNYATHAIVAMAERLRAAPGAFGLVSGLGWYMTKHAVGIYSAAPPARPWERPDAEGLQARIDGLAHPTAVATATGRARIETYTVVHDHEGAVSNAVIVARLEDGTRTFASLDPDPDAFALLEREEMVGALGHVRTDGESRNRFRLVGG